MSKQTQQFFDQLKSGEKPTLLETIKEAASTIKDLGGRLWDEAKPMFDHGRSEAAALLFTGQSYVMYMKAGQGAEHTQDHSANAAEQQTDLGREL